MGPNSRTQWNSWESSIGVHTYRLTLIEVEGPLILTPSPSIHLCRWWERGISIRRHSLQWCEDPLILCIIFNQFHNAFWSLHQSPDDYNSVFVSENETFPFYSERYWGDLHALSQTLRRKIHPVNFMFRLGFAKPKSFISLFSHSKRTQ